MKTVRPIRLLIVPSTFLGASVGLILGGVLFQCGVPAEASLLLGWALGFGLVLQTLRKM